MTRPVHFISGLPRSGSTLLSAILRQNPKFHAGISSPIAGLFETIIARYSAGSESASQFSEEQKRHILQDIFYGYYKDKSEDVIFDTNRAWTANLPLIKELFPESRVICTVRNVAWIMDSLERRYRSNAFEHTRLFNSPQERATVYTRVEALAGPNRLVGYAWHALREACWGEEAKRLILVDYELLTSEPEQVVRLIYDFLEEPYYNHDYKNIDFDEPEFDAQLGVEGLHRVKPAVKPNRRSTILPPDLFEKYSQLSFWINLKRSTANRIVPQPSESEAESNNSDQIK